MNWSTMQVVAWDGRPFAAGRALLRDPAPDGGGGVELLLSMRTAACVQRVHDCGQAGPAAGKAPSSSKSAFFKGERSSRHAGGALSTRLSLTGLEAGGRHRDGVMVDVGEDRGFDAVGDTDLHHQVGEVRLDGAFGNGQLSTDCPVWCCLPDEDEDLALAGRQALDSAGVSWREGACRVFGALRGCIVDARVVPGQGSSVFLFLHRGAAWHGFPLRRSCCLQLGWRAWAPHRRGGRMCDRVGCPTPPGWGNRPGNSNFTRRRVV